MKDKQKFISSVIVSLLAGFIYYQFGEDIQTKFQSSVKAVLSYNESEQYLPADCQPFNSLTKNFNSKESKKKKKFFVKKNTIEFKSKEKTISGDELLSDYVSRQASFKRPVADKNNDFSAELDQLRKNDAGKQSQKLKATKDEFKSPIADTKGFKSANNLLHKNAVEFNLGNGFEYNYIIEVEVAPKGKVTPELEKKKIKIRRYQRDESFNSQPNSNSDDYETNAKYSSTSSNGKTETYTSTSEVKSKTVKTKVKKCTEIESSCGNTEYEFKETGMPDENSDDGSNQ